MGGGEGGEYVIQDHSMVGGADDYFGDEDREIGAGIGEEFDLLPADEMGVSLAENKLDRIYRD